MPPEVVDALAAKFSGVPDCEICTVCAGAVPPCGWLKFSVATGTTSDPDATVSVTGIWMGLFATGCAPVAP